MRSYIFLFGLSLFMQGFSQHPYAADVFPPEYSAEKLETLNRKHLFSLQRRDPLYLENRAKFEGMSALWIQNSKQVLPSGGPIVIPIVFHIVYNQPAEYITDAQVMSQMVVINEDFMRMAADTVNTPAPFAAIAGNPGIQFCLAQQDPSGNPTTGIERRQTSAPPFNMNDGVKFYNQGGLDIWDPARYFNVWVCNTTGVCWGEFPTGTVSNTFGAVMHYTMFGSNYTQYGTFPNISAYYDRGEIMIHEIGHCFNLRHIWGDDNIACTGSDTCADTPNQAGPSSFCPTFPLFDACTPSGNGIMFNNFMDYSDDDCYNLLTQGQVARIMAVLNNPPYNGLTTSNGCVPVPIFNYDAAVTGVNFPSALSCVATFSPIIMLKNWGSVAMNSCVITYQVDANPPLVFNWFGLLGSLTDIPVTLPAITVSQGMHSFTVASSQPNGFSDAQPSNDQYISNFNAYSGGAPLPQTEGFEGITFPPLNWMLFNPDNDITWERTTQASKTGLASSKISNMYYNDIGAMDDLQLMPVNLSSVNNPALSFQVAYTYYIFSNPPNPDLNFTDTLQVQISTDCGTSWNALFQKGGQQLSTAAPVINTSIEFIPQSNEWRLEQINLSAYATSNNVLLRFRNKTGWGNRVYLDDINIFSTTGVEEWNQTWFSIHPNPSDGNVTLNWKEVPDRLVIYDDLGRIMHELKPTSLNQTLNLEFLDPGIYFFETVKGEMRSGKKWIRF